SGPRRIELRGAPFGVALQAGQFIEKFSALRSLSSAEPVRRNHDSDCPAIRSFFLKCFDDFLAQRDFKLDHGIFQLSSGNFLFLSGMPACERDKQLSWKAALRERLNRNGLGPLPDRQHLAERSARDFATQSFAALTPIEIDGFRRCE